MFGATAVGRESTPQALVAVNTSKLPISIARITTTSDFGVTSDCAIPRILAPDEKCTIMIRFKPTVLGSRKATARIVNTVDIIQPLVTLTGVGVGEESKLADLFLRIRPTPMTVAQGDLITYAFPVWNLGPSDAAHEILTTQVPAGTTFDYIRISGTPGLGTCTHPPYQGTGQIVCHENSSMAPNTTWTVRLTVRVTAPSGTAITENGTVTEDTLDSNLANNTATVSTTVQ
jgi:uncharacterized repeat protein (TIGR01451 family)